MSQRKQLFADDALGQVILVGAGPGDPELLTLKAVRALEAADVVLFDSLVSAEILEFVKSTARTICVGKRGGKPSCKQDDIHAMMLRFARQGKTVIRLKSGDPMIFGRAGEEIAMLKEQGIAVQVIPGVTAALAAASNLGVSLTHRGCAQGVKFITAHSRHGELPDLDWRACADNQTTLMVYMGARTAPKLAKALLEQGANSLLPVMIAKGVSRANEEVSYHRLTDLLDMHIEREMPVLLGLGRVFEDACYAYERAQEPASYLKTPALTA